MIIIRDLSDRNATYIDSYKFNNAHLSLLTYLCEPHSVFLIFRRLTNM